MHIRPALPSDEPALVRICTRAFFEEDLFGRVIHPHRHTYPEDVAVFWREQLRAEWIEPRNRIMVAVTSPDADKPTDAPTDAPTDTLTPTGEQIVGLAVWQRQGSDAGVDRIRAEWQDPGAFPPAPTTINRAIAPENKDILERTLPFFKHLWAGDRANTWYLVLCCVDPAVSGRGAGRAVVQWGLDQARSEGVCASVTASAGNEKFYLKCGFDEIVGNACLGEGNPLGEMQTTGGDVLFMWAREVDVRKT
jgi:GNAT superfamily N-acetyltransferase